jgi:hypothetical protein
VKHRLIGAVLFGFGVLFIVIAVGLRVQVGPAVTGIPYDQERSFSTSIATGATAMQASPDGIKILQNVDLRSVTNIVPNPKVADTSLPESLKGKAVVWTVYSTTSRNDNPNSKVSESSTELALDRVSGEAANWDGAWIEESERTPVKIAYKGIVYKFPFHTEQKEYEFWDAKLRATAPVKFVKVEQIDGLEVYRFEQRIERREIPKPAAESLNALLGAVAPGATDAKMFYSINRVFWVEPVTGLGIKRQDQPFQELVPNKGPAVTLLKANFESKPEEVKQAAKDAAGSKMQLLTITLYAPIGLGVLGFVLCLVGVLVTRRGERPSPGAHAI